MITVIDVEPLTVVTPHEVALAARIRVPSGTENNVVNRSLLRSRAAGPRRNRRRWVNGLGNYALSPK